MLISGGSLLPPTMGSILCHHRWQYLRTLQFQCPLHILILHLLDIPRLPFLPIFLTILHLLQVPRFCSLLMVFKSLVSFSLLILLPNHTSLFTPMVLPKLYLIIVFPRINPLSLVSFFVVQRMMGSCSVVLQISTHLKNSRSFFVTNTGNYDNKEPITVIAPYPDML